MKYFTELYQTIFHDKLTCEYIMIQSYGGDVHAKNRNYKELGQTIRELRNKQIFMHLI